MKYRIQVRETGSGKSLFLPQYKRFFRWKYYYNNLTKTFVCFYSKQDALNFISTTKVKKIKYINYE